MHATLAIRSTIYEEGSDLNASPVNRNRVMHPDNLDEEEEIWLTIILPQPILSRMARVQSNITTSDGPEEFFSNTLEPYILFWQDRIGIRASIFNLRIYASWASATKEPELTELLPSRAITTSKQLYPSAIIITTNAQRDPTSDTYGFSGAYLILYAQICGKGTVACQTSTKYDAYDKHTDF